MLDPQPWQLVDFGQWAGDKGARIYLYNLIDKVYENYKIPMSCDFWNAMRLSEFREYSFPLELLIP